MPPKRVVYTVLTGNYEVLQEQPAAIGGGIDLVCLTDDPGLSSPTWQVRHIPRALPSDQVRSSRRMKILTHEYLSEYDESLYIDNIVLLQASPEVLFDALLPPDAVMALMRHSFRGPVRDEYPAVVEAGLDASWVCQEQRAHYERSDPASLDQPTLWSGLMLRRHNVPAVRAAMQTWWEHVLRYSRRDQLSLPLVLRTANFAPIVHEYDIFSSPYHVWPHLPPGTTRATRAPASDGPEVEIAKLERRIADLQTELAAMSAQGTERDALRLERDAIRAERDQLRTSLEELRTSRAWPAFSATRAISAALRARRAGYSRSGTRRRSSGPTP